MFEDGPTFSNFDGLRRSGCMVINQHDKFFEKSSHQYSFLLLFQHIIQCIIIIRRL